MVSTESCGFNKDVVSLEKTASRPALVAFFLHAIPHIKESNALTSCMGSGPDLAPFSGTGTVRASHIDGFRENGRFYGNWKMSSLSFSSCRDC